MAFLEEAADSPDRAALYAADQDHQGYVANYTRVFSHRPDVYRAWQALAAAVKSTQPEIHKELIANLLSNGHMVAAGVVAINRAQERGYSMLTAG